MIGFIILYVVTVAVFLWFWAMTQSQCNTNSDDIKSGFNIVKNELKMQDGFNQAILERLKKLEQQVAEAERKIPLAPFMPIIPQTIERKAAEAASVKNKVASPIKNAVKPNSIIRLFIDPDSKRVIFDHTYIGEFPIFTDGTLSWAECTSEPSEHLILTVGKDKFISNENYIFWGEDFQKSSYENREELSEYFTSYCKHKCNKLADGAPPQFVLAILDYIRERKREHQRIIKNDIEMILEKEPDVG